MKKSKRILSAITALAISASAFASMVIPASAAETTLYTMDVSSISEAVLTKNMTSQGETTNAKTALCDVPDFGTGTTDATYGVAAVEALDGWGYKHFANSALEVGKSRETSASVNSLGTNSLSVAGVGVSGCAGYIFFQPENKSGITLPSSGYLIYDFDAVVKSTAGSNNTGSPSIGFASVSNSEGLSVGQLGKPAYVAAPGVNGESSTYKIKMVYGIADKSYAIYKDGIRAENGTADSAANAIYIKTESNKWIAAGAKDFVLKSDTDAPATGSVAFKEEDGKAISSYTALPGTTISTPTAKNITGKTFIGWTKNSETTLVTSESVTAEASADDIYVATYREGADYSNIVVKSSPYTKVELTLTTKASDLDDSSLTQEKITGFTDGTGSYTASHVVRGEYSYTLTKTGYTTKSGTFTLAIQDYALNDALSLTDDQSGRLLYYETDFVNGAGNFGIGKTDRNGDLVIPDIELDGIKTVSFDMSFGDTLEKQYTLMLINNSNKDVVGLQGTLAEGDLKEGLYAFTDFNGKDGDTTSYIHAGGSGKFDQSVKMSDTYDGTRHVEITFNPTGKSIAVKVDDTVKTLTMTQEDFTISKVRVGKYRNQTGTLYIDNLEVTTPDPNEVIIAGDDAFAKIAGKTVTRQYTATPAVYIDGEEFTWAAVDSTTGQAVTGITIDDNGLLSVEDTATVPTTLKITATSKTTPAKKGETTVSVNNYATLIPTIEGPKAIETGKDGTYKVTKIMDNYGDDVTEYYTPVWTIDGENTDTSVTFENATPGKAFAITAKYDDTELESVFAEEVTIPANGTLEYSTTPGAKVMLWNTLGGMEPVSAEVKTAPAGATVDETTTVATVGGKSGEVTTYETDGTFTLTVTLAAGQTATYPVKVDKYYDIVDYEKQSTVDVENLVEDAAITGYLVTLSDADDVKVAELVTDAATAQATGAVVPAVPAGKTATQIEVAPVFTTTIGTEIAIPSNRYNITLAANNGGRTDVYVNNQMVVNNLNQGDDGWSPARVVAAGTYNIGDVVIAEGYAKFKYDDNQDGRNLSVDSIKVSKAPEIVNRAQRVYVVGDSLVATYYGSTGTEANDKLARTGWGQVLGNYLKNVEVTNLGNSGAWATAMLANAYTNIAASAQPGDIVVWESGYNDTKHGGTAPMKAAIKVAIDECKAKGVKFYLVTPNASNHDYRAKVESSEGIRELAKETNTPLIDLATISYDFFVAHYGEEKALLRPTYNNNADNGLHSSCNAANVFASIVAQGLYDAGETDIVNTEYTYTFTDTKTTPETFNIKVTPSAE